MDPTQAAIERGLAASEALEIGRARMAIGMRNIAAIAGSGAVRAVFDAEMVLIVDRFGDEPQGPAA